MFKQLFKFQLALFTLILAGCATVAPTPTAKLSWPQREAQLSAIRSWNLNGAMSVTQNGRTSLASFSWQQQGRSFTQTISGPFGVGAVRIIGEPGRVTLWKSQTQQISAYSPEELLQQQFGWRLPISNMYYWIRGLPVPGLPAEKQLDAANHIVVLRQEGWTVQYQAYQTVNGIDLPKTILINNGQLQSKFVIRSWQI